MLKPSHRLLFLLLAAVPAFPASMYTLTDLGVVSGKDINSAGHVTGFLRDANNVQNAFIYANGSFSMFASSNGPSAGISINDSDQVAGFYGNAAATFTTAGAAMLAGDGVLAYGGTGINNSGKVVGTGFNPNTLSTNAAIWNNGNLTTIGQTFFFTDSQGVGVNNSGTVLMQGDQNVVTLDNSGFHVLFEGTAKAINNNGDITGFTTGGAYQAFLYQNGVQTSLPLLGAGLYTLGVDVNDNGVVVGHAYVDADRTMMHAFVYSGAVLSDLNDLIPTGSGITLALASAINNSGQIVAIGGTGGNRNHTYILTPDSLSADAPEPGSVTLGIAGLVWLATIRRRRHTRA